MSSVSRSRIGTPRQVITNSFVISKLPTTKYSQYEAVTYDDGRAIKNPRRRIEIVEKLQNHVNPKLFTPRCVYDGTAILYSPRELPLAGGDSHTFEVSMSEKPQQDVSAPARGLLHVVLKKVSGETIDFGELQAFIEGRQTRQTPRVLAAINVLQLIVRQAPNLKYPNNARTFFTKDAGILGLGGGLELWRGYFQSVRPTIGKVLINIDISTTVMYKEGGFQAVALAVLRQNDARALDLRPDSQQFRLLKSFFKDVFVTFVHRSGKKKIRGLVPNAGNFEFEGTTVKDYFKKAYGRQLAYPNAIGIQVGSKGHDVIIPAELCRIASDQRYTRKLPAEFSPSMVKFSSKSPQDRLALISAGINNSITADQRSALDYQNSPFMQDAGITVIPEPISITGRVLPTPSIYYGGDPASTKPVIPRNGSWNVVDQMFHSPKEISAWGILNYTRLNEATINRFIGTLVNTCQKLGMNTSRPVASQSGSGASSVVKDMKSLADQVNRQAGKLPTLVLVILPTSSADIYMAVKQFGDVHVGVPTQCVRENKIERANDQYCANLGMKINAKLGGANALPRSSALEKLVSAPFMIMGADVGHPAPGMKNQPSVASLVWSHDRFAVRYEAMMSIQHPRQEKIDELRKLVYRAINEFGERNNVPPSMIVFFRDGLSEGEYNVVGKEEIDDIGEAIKDVWQEKKLKTKMPELTFIVVGKRHHVRFFPRNKDEADRSGNCPAGFVADNGVGNPAVRDFYLQSHGGLLGTSRPSHYITLRDDIYNNNTDELQELAFTLCHSYARATRSVSIPAPVYYADLVCSRGAFHSNPALGYDAATVSSDEDSFDLDRWRHPKNFKDRHPNLAMKMHFM